ncbi:platelet glycoprotein Ib alpha chain-like [Parambassis ranga]|uniref:Platelet glycoprotein Ib alpha chain-like n=1 Tax=Parambassis ranga TaxID=210632 RepID=A0A6P7IKM5_9TELE|nr:platelet glycoprotein Ib alpha chain-like [Parambassis ranga]
MTVLLFPKNLFSSLSWASFQIFDEIYEIDLTENKVPEVTPSGTPILPTLSVLRLGSNRLTFLPDGSFSACPALTELYLENNAIDSLSNLSGLDKLEILDLTSNRITVLPALMLHPLPAIETLYLENNKIRVMPDNWFSQKEEVPYLYLSANPWACSCSLDYLRRYLDDYELNVYVRDGPDIKSDADSVVCDSPHWHQGKPVMSLEESDLCSSSTELGPSGDFHQPSHPATQRTTTPATPVTATSSPPISPPPTLSTVSVELYTVYHRVVTWSWYQTFTSLIEWSDHSGSLDTRTEEPSAVWYLATPPTPPATTPSTANPTTTPVPVTSAPTTPSLQTASAPGATETSAPFVPPWRDNEALSTRRRKARPVGAAGGFCVWLFAGCLLLCAASAVCVLVTAAKLLVWYKRVYTPLTTARRRGGREGVMLSAYNRRTDREEAGGGGILALYRSVLFVHRDEGEGGVDREGGGTERQLVTLTPTGGVTVEEAGERGGAGLYRKTLYRPFSREDELEGWRDVMEECRVSAEGGGRRRGRTFEEMHRMRSKGGGGASKKHYSVILREEREAEAGGREELDWVVGGWEVNSGGDVEGAEPRSSWGEWMAQFLPSMPWAAPTNQEAASGADK